MNWSGGLFAKRPLRGEPRSTRRARRAERGRSRAPRGYPDEPSRAPGGSTPVSSSALSACSAVQFRRGGACARKSGVARATQRPKRLHGDFPLFGRGFRPLDGGLGHITLAARCALGQFRSALGQFRSAHGQFRSAHGRFRSALGRLRSALGRSRSALGRLRSAPGRSRSAPGQWTSAAGGPRTATRRRRA